MNVEIIINKIEIIMADSKMIEMVKEEEITLITLVTIIIEILEITVIIMEITTTIIKEDLLTKKEQRKTLKI